MEENQIVTLDAEQFEKIEIIISNQEKIIQQQNKIIDYYIPTDEELEQQNQEEIKNQELQEENQQQQYEKFISDITDAINNNEQLVTISNQLTIANESLDSNVGFSSTNSSLMYVLVLGCLLTVVTYYIYKLIRAWFI